MYDRGETTNLSYGMGERIGWFNGHVNENGIGHMKDGRCRYHMS